MINQRWISNLLCLPDSGPHGARRGGWWQPPVAVHKPKLIRTPATGEKQGTKTPNHATSAHDRRAISVPLTRVTKGQPRSLGTARSAWSASLAAVSAALPKLIVRVRFSSPASRHEGLDQGTSSRAWALIIPGGGSGGGRALTRWRRRTGSDCGCGMVGGMAFQPGHGGAIPARPAGLRCLYTASFGPAP